MLALEWRLTILTLLVFPGFIIAARRLGPKLQKITRESMQLNAEMNNTIAERFNVAGALVVKLFGNHDRERDTFAGRRRARPRHRRHQRDVLPHPVRRARARRGGRHRGRLRARRRTSRSTASIGVGTIAAFVVYVGQMYTPLTQLTNARVDVMTALVSFERVFEVLDFPPLITERPGAFDLVDPEGRIGFDNVWFRHPSPSLSSLASLEDERPARPRTPTSRASGSCATSASTVEPGELVALVGPSGAGKTTTAMLVPRIYDVNDGHGHASTVTTCAT